mgnify:FL=1
MEAPVDWLLSGEPYVRYRTRLDLMRQDPAAPEVRDARAAMLEEPLVRGLLADLADWPGKVIASHRSAGQPFHKLTFLADLGLTVEDPPVRAITRQVLARQSGEGPFQLPVAGSAHLPSGEAGTWGWALCDAPLLIYALAKFGLAGDPAVRRALDHVAGLVRDNGWPCAVSKELGGFRGPGRKDDPCPYATLAMLKAFSAFEGLRDGPACHVGAETLLALWSDSRTQHPYMFYMGTDFRKLKVPFVWYDLMHVLDVLSQFDWLSGDARLSEMVAVMTGKMDAGGRLTPESVWTAWKDWEFGQKKAPSRWLTLSGWRILGRVGGDGGRHVGQA